MKSVALKEATLSLPDLIDEVRDSGASIEISEEDQPAAYLVEAENFKRLQGLGDSVRASRLRQALQGERYDLEEVLAELNLGR
jgi:prevent-host-death family protein